MKLQLLPEKPKEETTPKSYQQTHRGSDNRKYTDFVKPMLAKLHEKAFDSKEWVFEIKWDGYRAIAELDGTKTRLYSRNGLSFESDYPVVYEELKTIKKKAIIDGEIVALTDDGIPSFQLLQQYGQGKNAAICYYVFDCLSINGVSVEDKTLLERKALLKKLLPESDIIRYCEHIAERGTDFFNAVKAKHMEGMIAKKIDSTYYEDSRSGSWLKVKNIINEEAVIAGYTEPKGGRKYFGALVLGIYKGKKLEYIGHTGTGFTDKTLRDVYTKMQPLITEKSPFSVKIAVNAPVTWVKPQLVCNLNYAEITEDGHRRHPVFTGLRIDKAAREVHAEVKADAQIEPIKQKHMPAANTTDAKVNKPTTKKMEKTAYDEVKHIAISDKEQTIDKRKLIFTHTDKVFWPGEGYTKGDVINYYNAISPYILKYLKDRPESLLRMPNGINSPGFFHKDAGTAAPEWIETYKMFSESADKEINYIICNNRATLLYLANLGCIEINPWNSRIKTADKPDYLVLDLDPSEKNTFEQVVETANVIKEILDKADAISFPKTSGATGIHIYVPLGAKYSYEQAKDFAHIVATIAQERLPEFTSLERSLSKRGNNMIYIDYLQNRKGQTLSSAYSVRPKPGASVSTPLEWSEVKTGLKPTDFTIKNIFSRLKQKGDLFEGVLKKGIDMKKCLAKLAQ